MKTAQCKTNRESAHHSTVNHEKHVFFSARAHDAGSFFSPVTIQPKLKVGAPDDQYERQADRVADAVVNSPVPNIQQQSMGNEEETLQRKCSACEKDEGLQMKSDSGLGANAAPPGISQKIQNAGGGTHLSDSVNSEMSQKMGADFSNVNIHTGPGASRLNQSLGARAFTHGNNIFFNSGEYNPGSREGKRLLAHELTHVVQQKKKGVFNRQIIQRAIQIPAGVAAALAAAGRFLLSCIIGAAFGVGLDYVWQRGAAWWNEQQFRWNTCSAIVSGIIGCVSAGVGSIIARAIFRHTGGHLERDFATKAVVWFITWLYSKFPVVPVAIIMKYLINMGCVDESEVPAEMRNAA